MKMVARTGTVEVEVAVAVAAEGKVTVRVLAVLAALVALDLADRVNKTGKERWSISISREPASPLPNGQTCGEGISSEDLSQKTVINKGAIIKSDKHQRHWSGHA